MDTKRINIESELRGSHFDSKALEETVSEAAVLLRQGEVVAFPTETVYGLGADALNGEACEKIFAVKGRPADNPLIVHVASIEEAKRVVREWTEQAEICVRNFWPGPLTIILPKAEHIPKIVSAGLDTVAVRMPSDPVALALITKAGCPLAAPSANISGKPSPTEGQHVWEDLQGKVPLIIDAGKCKVGLESTVLDLTGEYPVILRPGGVTWEQLSRVLGRVENALRDKGQLEALEKPKSPGMKYRHYAPEGEMTVIAGTHKEKLAQIEKYVKNKEYGEKVGVICLKETAALLMPEIINKVDLLFILGSDQHPEKAASRLFEGLRLCDKQNIKTILAEEMSREGIGAAFMNRLQKAAGKNDFTDPKYRERL